MLNKEDFIKKHALKIFESPRTGNACHVISFPRSDGLVVVNDLDMGTLYPIDPKKIKRQEKIRDVEPEDFQFSWVIDCYNEELYELVAELTPLKDRRWDV